MALGEEARQTVTGLARTSQALDREILPDIKEKFVWNVEDINIRSREGFLEIHIVRLSCRQVAVVMQGDRRLKVAGAGVRRPSSTSQHSNCLAPVRLERSSDRRPRLLDGCRKFYYSITSKHRMASRSFSILSIFISPFCSSLGPSPSPYLPPTILISQFY